jgi:hypothetical protein
MPIGGLAKELIGPLGHNFEPHVAEQTVQSLLQTAGNAVVLHRNVVEITNVETEGNSPRRIVSLTTGTGLTVCGHTFIDCSYEGDLLRFSGGWKPSCTLGSNLQQFFALCHRHRLYGGQGKQERV